MPLDQVALAPNTQNLFYGKGKLFFDRKDVDNNPTGLLHLGWVDSFSLDLSTTTKEIEGSIQGPKKVLKSVEVGPRKVSGSFIAREWSADNLLLAVGGDSATTKTQTGGSGGAVTPTVTAIALDRWLQMYHAVSGKMAALRNIAQWNKGTTPWTAITPPMVTAPIGAEGAAITLVAGTDYDIDHAAGLMILYSSSATLFGGGAAADGLLGCDLTITGMKIYDTIADRDLPVMAACPGLFPHGRHERRRAALARFGVERDAQAQDQARIHQGRFREDRLRLRLRG